jgi:hypothetical protein
VAFTSLPLRLKNLFVRVYDVSSWLTRYPIYFLPPRRRQCSSPKMRSIAVSISYPTTRCGTVGPITKIPSPICSFILKAICGSGFCMELTASQTCATAIQNSRSRPRNPGGMPERDRVASACASAGNHPSPANRELAAVDHSRSDLPGDRPSAVAYGPNYYAYQAAHGRRSGPVHATETISARVDQR